MEPSRKTTEIFRSALRALASADIPFLVGGAFAVERYTGYLRYAKALDLFLDKRDVNHAIARLDEAAIGAKVEHQNWLAKGVKNDSVVNLIFGFGNWTARVDSSFFARGVGGEVLGVPVRLLAPEEIIWFASYLAARERFESSDILHLIHALQGKLDWRHLLGRLGEHWQLLFANIVLFDFVYPAEADFVPLRLVDELTARMRRLMKSPAPKEKLCRGTLLDRYSFIHDVEEEGYGDAREGFAAKLGYGVEQVVEDRIHARAAIQPRLK